MNNAKKLLGNTLMLTAAAFIMRTADVGYNVYLTNKIGTEGTGLYHLIMSVYAMSVVFSSAGIKLASMRLVADSLALGRNNQRQVMKTCLIYGMTAGTAIAASLCFFSSFIAGNWIGDKNASHALDILCVSLPFVSMSAALNGYFTSAGKIMRYTFVQFAEQIFKISLTVFLLSESESASAAGACACVAAGISCGEIFSLAASFSVYLFTSRSKTEKTADRILKNLLRISVPDALGSCVRSVLTTLEHLLIPKGLRQYGSSPAEATASYGVVHGMCLPVLLYPSALLSSLSGLLVPEISALRISGQKIRIDYMIRRVLHITLIFSTGTAGIILLNSELLSEVFYKSDTAAFYMKILAPLIPVMYCDMSVDGMLKGLDQQLSYMRYNIIDAASCVVLVYFLVPVMGVKGYILVIYLSEILNFFLSFRRLTVVAGVEIDALRDLLLPAASVVPAKIINIIINYSFSFNKPLLLIIRVPADVFIYFCFLKLSGAVDSEDINWFRQLIKK